MNYRYYLYVVWERVKGQKMLAVVFGLTVILVVGVVGMPIVNRNARSANEGYRGGNTVYQVTPGMPAEQGYMAEEPNQTDSDRDLPAFTKFVYVIMPFLRPANDQSRQTAPVTVNTTQTNNNLAISPTTVPIGQTDPGQSNSINPQSGGSSGGNGQSSGGQAGGAEPGASTPTPTPFNIIAVPTPTPVTIIDIVFEDEGGSFGTYVPPTEPPIDTGWLRYTNYQDNFSIEIPSDWKIVKSIYNGHESVTLYNPADEGKFDKPSISFVGWPENYLKSAAKYTGSIVLNDIKGTLYTSGFLGPSSIAAVFNLPNGFFAIGSSISDPIFIYVFDHMLRSIDFSP